MYTHRATSCVPHFLFVLVNDLHGKANLDVIEGQEAAGTVAYCLNGKQASLNSYNVHNTCNYSAVRSGRSISAQWGEIYLTQMANNQFNGIVKNNVIWHESSNNVYAKRLQLVFIICFMTDFLSAVLWKINYFRHYSLDLKKIYNT